MTTRTLRGKTAIVGIGETTYYKRGKSPLPEFRLALDAILAAVADAGLKPHDIDGFASFADERSTPTRLASALGLPELKFASLAWEGGGGGGASALGTAAAAVATGVADCVVVWRAITSGAARRGVGAAGSASIQGDRATWYPYGMISPAQMFAMRVNRFMHDHKIDASALQAIAMASYFHAQTNPRAVMYGKPLTPEAYDDSRYIIEPFHRLFDCCQENDGASAVIVTSAERARDLKQKPAYILGAAQGTSHRFAARTHNSPDYASAGFTSLAPRLYEMAGVKPSDIDTVQFYENFTGGVLMALVEHGFVQPDEANEFLKLENLIAPDGKLPLNTSGGNLAECYMHGIGLQIEAVRQLRGQSAAQVKDAKLALMASGPMVAPTSNVIFGTAETL
jgi:acetyl-CoA acetyltransferase